MPLFQPRSRVEILRSMIARVISRSKLVGIIRNSVVFHLLAAAADEDADQYLQMANLRRIFSIDKATGSDLDARAAEIQPAVVKRRTSAFASGDQRFLRTGTAGATVIPIGTIVFGEDAAGPIKFRTTALGTITAGNTFVDGVPIVALEAGARGNVEPGTLEKFGARIPGIVATTNLSKFTNGADREADDTFRARLKRHVQSLSRGTPAAIESFVLNVILVDGRQVLFAHVVEPTIATGHYTVYVDDGTGTIEEFDDTFLSSDDTLIASAAGGEIEAFTTVRPIRDDGDFVLKINAAVQVRGTDYFLNPALGMVELVTPLTLADTVTARFRFYTGLIQEAQRVVDGDLSSPLTHPGVRAAGTFAQVLPAQVAFQELTANLVVKTDFDTADTITLVEAAIIAYINGLDIGAPVVVAEIIERAMKVDGMFNFQITDLSGTFPAVDQIMTPNQVARITSGSLAIT